MTGLVRLLFDTTYCSIPVLHPLLSPINVTIVYILFSFPFTGSSPSFFVTCFPLHPLLPFLTVSSVTYTIIIHPNRLLPHSPAKLFSYLPFFRSSSLTPTFLFPSSVNPYTITISPSFPTMPSLSFQPNQYTSSPSCKFPRLA